ncbi:MAG TPA: SH3 domain-containing protein [Terriglobales bacterium]|nr:SH3 domain-containing protein [Terriglobales bacterium]
MSDFPLRVAGLALCLASLLLLPGCGRGRGRVLEIAYVSSVQASLRDHVAAVYEKAGTVKNGDRVEVLDHDRHFVKVRNARGETGWIEQRYLVGQDIYDQIQKLTAEHQRDPLQAQGVTRNDTNLHVEPGRDTEHLYQISTGEKLALLKRATADKPGAVAPPPRAARAATQAGGNSQDKKEAVPVLEDWWLVRDSNQRVGWVLSRMVDVDVPLDVAQYAEGQRIVAVFVLDQVQDKDKEKEKKVPEYLTAVTEPKDGLPFDFNQIRVFTWDVRHHRYETAYRERVDGVLPVTVAKEDFDKEGTLPTFTIRTQDDAGKIVERKYRLKTPIVRRVLAPGEEPVHSAAKRTTGRSKSKH